MSQHQAPDMSQFFELAPAEINLDQIEITGRILDIGGGGEGTIGVWRPNQVIAIDRRRDELEEAAEGPIKLVMDAQELLFLDACFENCTLFYTLMYMPLEVQQKAAAEIYRILKPGGFCYVWDVNYHHKPEQTKDRLLTYLSISTGEKSIQTGFGVRLQPDSLNAAAYLQLFETCGFNLVTKEITQQDHCFLVLQKPE